MPKSAKSTLHKRNRRIQISLNNQETLDMQLIEEVKGIKIQEFIRTLIRDHATLIRHNNK